MDARIRLPSKFSLMSKDSMTITPLAQGKNEDYLFCFPSGFLEKLLKKGEVRETVMNLITNSTDYFQYCFSFNHRAAAG